jgi:hypothetical protein
VARIDRGNRGGYDRKVAATVTARETLGQPRRLPCNLTRSSFRSSEALLKEPAEAESRPPKEIPRRRHGFISKPDRLLGISPHDTNERRNKRIFDPRRHLD